MAETTLNMKLLLRRAEFADSCVLALGEPGYHTGTKEFKIGDGSTTWANLPIANQSYFANYKTLQEAISAVETDANVFVDTVAQDANGVITITTKAVDFSAADDRFKKLQTAIEAVATEKNVFIEKIAQDAQGVITISTKAVDFSAYRTAADQDAIDATLASKEALKVVTDELATYGNIVTHNVAEFATAAQGAKADAAAVKADVDAAIENITNADGLIATAKSEAIAAAKTETETQVNTLANGTVKTNTDAIAAINDAETGILKQAKAYVDEEDKFEIDMNTINALGGIAAGSDLNNMTTHDILKKLLYPYVDASIGNATASPSNGGTVEVGSTQTITGVSISVTKKSEPITSIVLYNGSEELARKEGSNIANGTNTFSGLNVPVTATTATSTGKLKVSVTYPGSDGVAKTINKETGAFTFVFPYYYGVCGAATALDAELIGNLAGKKVAGKGSYSFDYETEAQRMVIAYPKAHNTLKLVKDGNGLDNTGAFGSPVTVSFTNEYGVTADYYIYANGVTTGTAKMTFTHN